MPARLLDSTSGAMPWNRHDAAGLRRRAARLTVYILLFSCVVMTQPQAMSTAVAQEAEPAVEWTTYRQLIDRAVADLADPSADDSVTANWQRQLAVVERVRLPTGGVVELRPLLGLPEKDPLPTPALARARLGVVQAQMASSAGDRTGFRLTQLATVLARDEFAVKESIWQRIQRWSWEQFGRFLPQQLPDLSGSDALRPMAQVIGWFVALAGFLMLAWLLSFWLQELLANFVPHVARRRGDDAAVDLPSSTREARLRAVELANIGNYRQAVRNLYLSVLLSLDEHQLIQFDRSLTNREVLARAPEDPALRAHLEPVMATFDRVWYGVQEPDRATFDTYRREIDELDQIMGE